jgi:Zn-dependent protease with chaperone function
MDFFGHQERARTHSGRLLFLFCLAVVLTFIAVYLVVAGILNVAHLFVAGPMYSPTRAGWFARLALHFGGGLWNWELFGWVLIMVLAVLLLGSGVKVWQLSRGGGAAVAEGLGGQLLDLHTEDPDERRLLNVVEEMAIASGLPVPDVYVLEDEWGINAFAAGREVSDAVIGVTSGALKLLTRDELQGVIAHEFSHILNGDMLLNVRLIGWLHGILGLVILGRILTLNFDRISRERGSPVSSQEHTGTMVFHPAFLPAFALGCGCIAAGSFGAFFARIIKSAVNRQREFLADAAAVQFTRNPEGVVGALMKVGGIEGQSKMGAARAEEASHMYFGDGMSRRWLRFTATHPPLTQRIRRINPHFDGTFPPVSLDRVVRESKWTALYRERGPAPVDFQKLASILGPTMAAKEVFYAQAARQERTLPVSTVAVAVGAGGISPERLQYAALFLSTIPEEIRAATRHPFGAVALIYGLVCDKDAESRARQMEEIAERTEAGIAAELAGLLPFLDTLDRACFLPLTELCLRPLRQLSPGQYESFRDHLRQLIEHDRQIDLFEYMLERMIVRHLDVQFRSVRKPPVQYYVLKPLHSDCAVLLSGMARIGQETEVEAAEAFERGALRLAPKGALQLLAPAESNLPQIDGALQRCAQASRPLKVAILQASALVVATDGRVERREAELLRAIADALDCPVPPFLTVPEGDHLVHGPKEAGDPA